jgi:putative hydrolase of the HAD superfamily
MNSSNGTSSHKLTQFPLQTDIKAIFFDLDGTLRHDSPSSNEVFFDFAVQLGAPDLPANRLLALRWAHAYWANMDKLTEQDFAQYNGSTPEFWQNYARRYLCAYGCPEDQAQSLAPQVHKHISEHHKPDNTVAPDAHTTLTILRKKGYILGVITNRSRSCYEELITLGLARYFDIILAAGEVNSYKPDPVIFEHALTRVGVQPQTSLYIGDNYYADIVGAARAGLVPVLLDPDHVFPEAECPVIDTLSDLHFLLNHAK